MSLQNKSIILSRTDAKVLSVLKKNGSTTRADLVSITGIARSTLYDSLLRLILKQKVSKFSEKPLGPGRPKVYFKAL